MWRLGLIALLASSCSPATVWQGEERMETLHLKAGEHLVVKGRECSLTLQGDFHLLEVEGEENYLEVRGKFRHLVVSGKSNLVHCQHPPGAIVLRGQGQRVRLPSSQPPPEVRVEGSDQAVQFFKTPTGEALPSSSAP